MPALILMGAGDPIVAAVNGRIMAARLPDVEAIGINAVGVLTGFEDG